MHPELGTSENQGEGSFSFGCAAAERTVLSGWQGGGMFWREEVLIPIQPELTLCVGSWRLCVFHYTAGILRKLRGLVLSGWFGGESFGALYKLYFVASLQEENN